MSTAAPKLEKLNSSEPAGEISRLADHFFRHESGKLVSVLTGIFGIERLHWAEDVVQEAMVRALQTWPYYGIPKNPAAWITQTAKNLALDLVRREKVFREKQEKITAIFEQWGEDSLAGELPRFDNEIRDDRLRLMFACCHPLVPPEAQTALTLKTLCGFSAGEIARAFLATEAAIEKRLTRARAKIRELKIPFEIPTGEDAGNRLDGVLRGLYFLFNEGYKASSGENLVRENLCREAINLAALLTQEPHCNQPRVHALLALMLLNAARLPARTDSDGNILLLRDQDRSQWDRSMIARGMLHLSESARGEEITAYHLQAGIAACHSVAGSYESTDWERILSLYNQWSMMDDSPVIALNRAVAIAQVRGAEEAMEAVRNMRGRQSLDSYYLYYSVMAEFEEQLHQFEAAAEHLRKAIRLSEVRSEQEFLRKRLLDLESDQRGTGARVG